MNRLLVLFGYPNGSAAAFLAGVLPFRYCSARFACKFPTWELPVRSHVGELVTESDIGGQVLRGEKVCRVPLPGSAGGADVLCEGRVGHQGLEETEDFLRLTGVLSVVLMFCMSVTMVMSGLLWVIGLEWCRILGCTGPRPQALHEGRSN